MKVADMLSAKIAAILKITIVVLLPIMILSQNGSDYDGWRVMPIRSQEEYNLGLIGGEAEQHNQGIARCRSNPNIIYLSHDCGQVWRSDNAGESWNKTLGKGLFVLAGQSIEVDPENPQIVFAIMDESWSWMHEQYQGLYRSVDGGDNWQFVLSAVSLHSRRYEHNIAYDITSIANGKAVHWYAAFHHDFLYYSVDGGNSWTTGADLSSLGIVYNIQVNPGNGNMVYLASDQGLFVSYDGGKSITSLGNLPSGAVTSVAVNEKNANQLFSVVRGNGLYRSDNSGELFTEMRDFEYALFVFINQGYPDVIYLVGESSHSLVTLDGGVNWHQTDTEPAPGLWRDTIMAGWKGNISGVFTGIVPNPENPNEAVAYSRAAIWKTTDGGVKFKDNSTLFTGYHCGAWNDGIAFDRADSNRFATFNADVGMAYTNSGGDYFYRRGVPAEWRDPPLSYIPWTSMASGDILPGTETIVAAVGDVWNKKLIRTTDAGQNWEIVDDNLENYFFIAFHPQDPDLVYAGNKRSLDGGRSFQIIAALEPYNASIFGMCHTYPDVIYAIARPRNKILRSKDRGASWEIYAEMSWEICMHDSKPTFAVHPSDSTIIFSIDAGGDLARYDGQHWQSLHVLDLAGSINPRNFVSCVILDPNHPEIIYTGMHACGIENLWRSRDGGSTWENISFNHPRTAVRALIINPFSGELMTSACYGTWVYPPPYESSRQLYNRCVARPSCHDDIRNGDEAGVDCGGNCQDCNGNPSGVPELERINYRNKYPDSFCLYANYPNPFNPNTFISFDIAEKTYVQLDVFSLTGKCIRSLVNQITNKGTYQVNWDGKDNRGYNVSSGLYFYRLTAGKYIKIAKMLLVR